VAGWVAGPMDTSTLAM